MRSYVLLVVLAGCSGAQASFDLFIMPDASAAGGYRRFDPINRVYLGTHQTQDPRFVAATSANSWGYYSYAGLSGGVIGLDNSTGEAITGTLTTFGSPSAMSLDSSGTRIAKGRSNGMDFFNTTSPFPAASGSYTSPASLSSVGAITLSNSRWIHYGINSSGALSVNLVSSSNGHVASATLASNVDLTGQGAAFIRQAGGNEVIVIPYRDSTGAHALAYCYVTVSSFTATGSQAITGYSTTSANTMLAAVSGHHGFFLVGADQTTSTVTRIRQYSDTPTFAAMQNYTTTSIVPVVGMTWSMSNLVAPEPGSMVALGLGIAALLTKRKQRVRAL